MITLIRVGRVLLITVLALMTVASVVGVVRPETGPLEKAVLMGLIGSCVLLAAKVTASAERWQHRLRH